MGCQPTVLRRWCQPFPCGLQKEPTRYGAQGSSPIAASTDLYRRLTFAICSKGVPPSQTQYDWHRVTSLPYRYQENEVVVGFLAEDIRRARYMVYLVPK